MYAYQDERSVEKVCYEQEHIDKVIDEINNSFPLYFENYLAYEAGHEVTEQEFQRIALSLGIDVPHKKRCKDKAESLRNILSQSIADFYKDRKRYLDIFDEETLEEYQDDPAAFKSKALRDECPIIKSTYYNKRAKVLDKYRRDFNIADANELLSVVTNLYNFAEDYANNIYEPETYDSIKRYEELLFSNLDTEDYTAFGVIGGGIKSHMLYKAHPSVFPNRSRMALWALWFLTKKKVIDCTMDSEFLMIDTKASITQQNYFYPYELFAFYAHQIFQLINAEAEKLGVYLDTDFRYISVDSFLSFVASCHEAEINLLMSQIREVDYAYI